MDARNAVRLAAAFALMEGAGQPVWPGWSAAPREVVLVDGAAEFLAGAPAGSAAPPGFAAAPAAAPLKGALLWRPRTFPPGFLATFPAFTARPVIVVGTAEAVGKRSTAWVLTVLHEHFHQLQYSDPRYFAETKALDLAGGDESGMWMLSYAFPYEARSAAFAALSHRLADLVEGAPRPEQRDAFWKDYASFCASLEAKDYRYLSLQLWQEGIARYTELRVAEAAARAPGPAPAFAALPDFAPYSAAAASLREGITKSLRTDTMAADKRIVFYAFGAGLGLLLDQEGVPWKARYLTDKFYLEKYRPH